MPAPPPEDPTPPSSSEREQEALASYSPSSVSFGGYIQPQFRSRQDSPAQFDQEGFRFARARLIGVAATRAGNLELSAFIEAEIQPTFDMIDAFATVARKLPHHGTLSLDLGQMRVPISRQQLLSDARLAFVDKGQIASIAPRRDLGARLGLVVPHLPQVRIVGGMFNGEGPNQIENINQKYLYAGRVEITPWGKEAQLAESSFGGHFVTVAGSFGRNALTAGTRRENVTYLGVDVSGSYKGLSGSFEYLEARHEFEQGDTMLVENFKANGFVAQLNYLLPMELPPFEQARIEIGARFEEIDRNDTVPIAQPGDPEQSVRAITAVATYYLRMHSLKAQLAFTRFDELEDMTTLGENAVYDNDQLLLQVTYRLE